MGISRTITMQAAATTAGNGTAVSPEFADAMTLEISGTSTSFSVVFEEQGASGTWYAYAGLSRADMTTLASTVTAKGMYQFYMSNVRSIRARIATIDNGNLTITGGLSVSDS